MNGSPAVNAPTIIALILPLALDTSP